MRICIFCGCGLHVLYLKSGVCVQRLSDGVKGLGVGESTAHPLVSPRGRFEDFKSAGEIEMQVAKGIKVAEFTHLNIFF